MNKLPTHVQRLLDEYMAENSRVKGVAATFAKNVQRDVASLSATLDPMAGELASQGAQLAERLSAFAQSPTPNFPVGTVDVAILYGVGDHAKAEALYVHLVPLRRHGLTIAKVPVSLTEAFLNRTRLWLVLITNYTAVWLDTRTGRQLQASCHGGACTTVPVPWDQLPDAHAWIAKHQGVPYRPIMDFKNRDEAIVLVVRAVRDALRV